MNEDAWFYGQMIAVGLLGLGFLGCIVAIVFMPTPKRKGRQ